MPVKKNTPVKPRAALSESRAAIKAARHIADLFDAGEFDEAKRLFVSEHGPRPGLVRLVNESAQRGELQVRDSIKRLLQAMFPRSPRREHGQLIRTCCDELLELLQARRSDDVRVPQRKRPRCPRGMAREYILGCMCDHHAFDGQTLERWTPLAIPEITAKTGVAKSTASAWFGRHFGSYDKYKAACNRRANGPLEATLRSLRGETTSFLDPEPLLQNTPASPDSPPGEIDDVQ